MIWVLVLIFSPIVAKFKEIIAKTNIAGFTIGDNFASTRPYNKNMYLTFNLIILTNGQGSMLSITVISEENKYFELSMINELLVSPNTFFHGLRNFNV